MFGRYKLACPTTFGQMNSHDDSYKLGVKKYCCCPKYAFCQTLPEVPGCPPCHDCCPKFNYYDDNEDQVINKQMEYLDKGVY